MIILKLSAFIASSLFMIAASATNEQSSKLMFRRARTPKGVDPLVVSAAPTSKEAESLVIESASNKTVDNTTVSHRDGKLLPIIRIITFVNDVCTASNGLTGTCYSSNECASLGGQAVGTCAKGYGICCVLTVTCDGTITVNNTYFANPGYPGTYSTPGVCLANIVPPAGTCQILITFDKLVLIDPEAGDCNNDTLTFVGGGNSAAIPILCGVNSGQHYYVTILSSTGSIYRLVATLSAVSFARSWNIKVTFLKCDSTLLAPYGCLQYYTQTSGFLSSFNFGGSNNLMLNNLQYAICFACIPGYCDIGINFSHFDLGIIPCTLDYLAVGPEKYCGDFSSLSVQLNATGPYVIWVGTDGDNDFLQTGFSGQYMMIAC